MKKKIIIFIFTIMIIISLFGLILYIIKDNKNEFPHYKQAYFKVEGSLFVTKDIPFDIPLIFVDSNENSEMSSSENIKSIKIIDDNNKSMKINRWTIINKTKESNFIIRNMQTETVVNEEGIFKPSKIIITYNDDVTKKYDFGDFNIICNSKEYYANNFAQVYSSINPIVTSKNNDAFPYSGLSMFIKGDPIVSKNSKEIEVEKIDLGIKSFGIDSDNLMYHQLDDDLNTIMNYVENGLSKNEKWAEKISKIKILEQVKSDVKPFKIEISEDSNKGTNILIPLTRLGNTSMNEVKIFNLKVTLKISGQVKELISFKPFYVTPFTFNKDGIYKFLEEEGI
jgi:hypothetical protein